MKLEQPDNLALIAALPEKPDSTVVDGCQLERDQDLYCAEFHDALPLALLTITSYSTHGKAAHRVPFTVTDNE